MQNPAAAYGFNPPTAPSSGGTRRGSSRPGASTKFQPTHRSFERWDGVGFGTTRPWLWFQPTHRSFERWDACIFVLTEQTKEFQPTHRSFERWDAPELA